MRDILGLQLQELGSGSYVLEGAVVVGGSVGPGRRPAADVSRRALLAASAATLPLLLTACKGVQALGTPPPPPADVRTLRAAILAEELMVTRYASAIQRLRAGLPPRATPADTALYESALTVRAEHVTHLAQLKSRLVEPPGARPSRLSPSPSPSPTTGGTSSAGALLGELEQAEQAASDRLIAEIGGLPPSLAQLFASIAASEATHVPYLRAGRQGQ